MYVLDPDQYRTFVVFATLVVVCLAALVTSTWGH